MSLTLTVDGDRWRAHLRGVAEATPGLVPVAKGNGYGFTLGRLARKAALARASTPLAVGTYEELPEVADRYAGDLLVLTPWRPVPPAPDPALAAGSCTRSAGPTTWPACSRRSRTPGSCSSSRPACAGTA